MKGLNLSGFKKMREDAKTATMIHKDGHQITVAKARLKPVLLKQLEKLPMYMADGGNIPPMLAAPTDDSSDQSNPADKALASAGVTPATEDQDAGTSAGGASGDWGSQDQAAQAAPTADMGQQAQAPMQDMSRFGGMNSGLQSQINANNQLAKAQGAEGTQSANAIQDVENQVAQLPTTDVIMKRYSDKDKQFTDYLEKNNVDPNHFWASRDTGQKIAGALGLLLGGWSSGYTHQGNPALGIINNAIERDIDAQKANLGKQHNLWSMNREAMKDDLAATFATRNQMYAGLQHTLQKIAATNQDPMAKARAAQLNAVIQNEMQQNNFRQSLISGPTADNADPSARVQFLVPKEQQKEAFKEIQDRQNANRVEPAMLDAFDRAAKENTVLRTGAGYLRTPESIMQAKALALPLIHDTEGRVNEFEAKTIDDLLPHPGDTDTKIAQKRVGLQQFIQQKRAAPINKGFGIDLDKFPSTANRPMGVIPVERFDKASGKVALFNPQTKQFIGYK